MTQYNTKDPVGSSSVKDLHDNSQNLDKAVNDRSNKTWTDRLGVERQTWHGIQSQANDAMSSFGYEVIDSFESGATLTRANQALRHLSTGLCYRWNAAFPVNIPAGTLPSDSDNWVLVGDATALYKLNQHIVDPDAHPQMIQKMNESLSAHNESPSAHPELSARVNESIANVTQKVDEIYNVKLNEGLVYLSIQEGMQQTEVGQVFRVVNSGDSAISLYKKTSATQYEKINDIPSLSAINKIKSENLLFDAFNEETAENVNLANLRWYTYSGEHVFNNTSNTLKLMTPVIQMKGAGAFVSKRYQLADLNLITGESVNFSVLCYSKTGRIQFWVYFRSASNSVIAEASKTIDENGKLLVTANITVPEGASYVELRVYGDKRDGTVGDFEVGGWFASYGLNVSFTSKSLPTRFFPFLYAALSTSENLLFDANQEFSSQYPTQAWNFYNYPSGKIPTFINNSVNYPNNRNVIVCNSGDRTRKDYDFTLMALPENRDIFFKVKTFSDVSNVKIYIQLKTKTGEFIFTPQTTIPLGKAEILLKSKYQSNIGLVSVIVDAPVNSHIEIASIEMGMASEIISRPIAIPFDYIAKTMNGVTEVTRNQFNHDALINYHMKTFKRVRDERTFLNVAFVGDSWTHSAGRYSGPMADILTKTYGDSGCGWVGFGAVNRLTPDVWLGANGNIRPDLYTMNYGNSADWNKNIYANCPSPDICCAGSDVAGATITVTGKQGKINNGKLFYIPSGGVFKYRFGDSEWVSINASGSEKIKIIDMQNLPQNDNWTLEVQVVSGECYICGVNLTTDIKGVVCHKLGATGSKARDWAAQNGAAMIESFKALNIDTAFVLLGTNDQGAQYKPESFYDWCKAITNRLRLANPAVDIVLVAPCENQRMNNTYLMSYYAEQLSKLAKEMNYGFINLQPDFGTDPMSYGVNGYRPLFAADLIHPDPLTGGRVITSSIWRFMNS